MYHLKVGTLFAFKIWEQDRGDRMGMDIRLARIDDRLIHGQVATVWSKQTAINRILVVSDK